MLSARRLGALGAAAARPGVALGASALRFAGPPDGAVALAAGALLWSGADGAVHGCADLHSGELGGFGTASAA